MGSQCVARQLTEIDELCAKFARRWGLSLIPRRYTRWTRGRGVWGLMLVSIITNHAVHPSPPCLIQTARNVVKGIGCSLSHEACEA